LAKAFKSLNINRWLKPTAMNIAYKTNSITNWKPISLKSTRLHRSATIN